MPNHGARPNQQKAVKRSRARLNLRVLVHIQPKRLSAMTARCAKCKKISAKTSMMDVFSPKSRAFLVEKRRLSGVSSAAMKQAAKQKNPTIGLVSLGCPKALVDSERILTHLRAEGYALSPSYEGADVVLVNTCGFLDSARDESLAAIGEAMAENGKVIVTGCMGATPELIRAKFPNVLEITGPQQYDSVINA